MDILKTNLVQSLEEIQEVNETFEIVAMMESYINYVNSSMAVPYDMLKRDYESSIAIFPEKPTLIKIDVTK